VGGAVYVFFQDLLSSYTKHWMIYFGLMFMAFILFSPNGILGMLEGLRGRLRAGGRTRTRRCPSPPPGRTARRISPP